MSYAEKTDNRSWLGLKTLLAIVNTNYYKTKPSNHKYYQEWMEDLSAFILDNGFEEGVEMEFYHLAKVIVRSSDLQQVLEENEGLGTSDRYILSEIGKQLDWLWVQNV